MKNLNRYIGKIILSSRIEDNELRLKFTDGTSISISDDMQQCCEKRRMTCDDDPLSIAGYTFTGIDIKECDDEMFIEVKTNQCSITLVNHNDHNGYYGGFNVTIERS